jgi:hypothetical protein
MDPAVSAFRQTERSFGNVATAGVVAICSCGKVFIPRRHKARSGIATPDRAILFQDLIAYGVLPRAFAGDASYRMIAQASIALANADPCLFPA